MNLTEPQSRQLLAVASRGWITAGQYGTRTNTLESLERLGLVEMKRNHSFITGNSWYDVKATDAGRAAVGMTP